MGAGQGFGKGGCKVKLWIVTGAIVKYESLVEMTKQGEELLKKMDVSVEVYRRFDISYTLDGNGSRKLFANGKEVSAPDRLFFYGAYDAYLQGIEDTLTAMGTVSINPIEKKRIAGSKLQTAQLLTNAKVPTIKTMPIYRGTPVEQIREQVGIPCVIKPDGGFGGKGVELIHDEEELKKYLAEIPENYVDMLLAQPYISTSKGRDVRVVMAGGKPYTAVIRQAGNPDEFRSNVHQGGYFEEYELTDEMRDIAEKATKAIGLTICGLDLLFGEDGFLVGEINDSPGMKQLVEKVGLSKLYQSMMG